MRSNLHTHTTFCDGRSTAEEMVRSALALGFTSLGFSGHSYVPFDPECGMAPDAERAYREEIKRLKALYGETIRLYCGIEQDYCSGRRAEGYEYAIGSVHYVYKDGDYLPVDWSAQRTEEIVGEHFDGDPYAYAESYYSLVGGVLETTGADIVGHFDLIRKFDEGGAMFDEGHPRYRAAVLGALDRLCVTKPVFEINTGAIARGYRSTPYPSLWILREIRRRGCPIVITSDCHSCAQLDCGYETAVRLARAAGFDRQVQFCGGGFEPAEF